MPNPKSLFKTTVVIWTDYDPSGIEIDTLAHKAVYDDAYCSEQHVEEVTDPAQLPDTDFFDAPFEEDNGDD